MALDDGHAVDDRRDVWLKPEEYLTGGLIWINRAIENLARALHPLYGMIRKETVADLPRRTIDDDEGNISELASPHYRSMEFSHKWTIDINDALNFDVGAFLANLLQLADSYGSQLIGGMLQHISDVADESGRSINAGGKNFIDVFIEAAADTEFSFDEDGNPEMIVVMHPDLARQLRENPPTPEQEERMTRVIEAKWEEWRAARRRSELS